MRAQSPYIRSKACHSGECERDIQKKTEEREHEQKSCFPHRIHQALTLKKEIFRENWLRCLDLKLKEFQVRQVRERKCYVTAKLAWSLHLYTCMLLFSSSRIAHFLSGLLISMEIVRIRERVCACARTKRVPKGKTRESKSRGEMYKSERGRKRASSRYHAVNAA